MGDSGQPAAGAPATARVHDLGYHRYRGPRSAQSSRYRIIARKVQSSAWRGWWRMKLWVIIAAMIAFIISVVMYVSEGVSSLMRGGIKLSLTDALLPMSIPYFEITALAMALTIGAVAVANDLRTGAFEFYFSRPVRARDYVLGKVVGMTAIMAIPLCIGPTVLSLVRLGLSDAGQLLDNVDLVWRAALAGIVAALAYAILPLAFSAISAQKRHTLPAFAAFYFMTFAIVPFVQQRSGIEALGALDISACIHAITYALFDAQPMNGTHLATTAALAGIVGYLALGLGFLYWRVARAERQGMGGR